MHEEIKQLESPIDIMLLMHKAFHNLSTRVEKLAFEGEAGGDLDAFKESFEHWVSQLLYHVDTEDEVMTPSLDSHFARDNESEHEQLRRTEEDITAYLKRGDSAELEDSVKQMILNMDEDQHGDLLEHIEDIKNILKRNIGNERIVARTRRHLYRKVMAMRILEYDHFENEEAFICPMVKEYFDAAQELELARRLLIQDGAEDPEWVLRCVLSEIRPGERTLLKEIVSRFDRPGQSSATV